MNVSEMKVGELLALTAALKNLGGPTQSPSLPAFGIVILDRGWVVGDISLDGDWLVTKNAQVVRAWGTTKGIGEIALGGPTSKTLLDEMGTIRSPLRAVIGTVESERAKWIK